MTKIQKRNHDVYVTYPWSVCGMIYDFRRGIPMIQIKSLSPSWNPWSGIGRAREKTESPLHQDAAMLYNTEETKSLSSPPFLYFLGANNSEENTGNKRYKENQESFGTHVDSCFVPGGSHVRDILAPLARTRPGASSSFFESLDRGCEFSEYCPWVFLTDGKA